MGGLVEEVADARRMANRSMDAERMVGMVDEASKVQPYRQEGMMTRPKGTQGTLTPHGPDEQTADLFALMQTKEGRKQIVPEARNILEFLFGDVF